MEGVCKRGGGGFRDEKKGGAAGWGEPGYGEVKVG